MGRTGISDEEASFLAQLAIRVRRARALAGLSRRALADASGVSERYLAQLESGEGNVSILLLRRLARALGVDPVWLLQPQVDSAAAGAEAAADMRIDASPDGALDEASGSSTG